MRRHGRQALVALAMAAAMVGLTGAAWWPAPRSGPEDVAAATAVRALRDGSDVAAVPEDFEQVMGYQPVDAGGYGLVKPAGDCSSPFGGTVFAFDLACKAHDYGYDLLRYAHGHGKPLGAWARRAIDEKFSRTMRAHCAERDLAGVDDPVLRPMCASVAAASSAAVAVNSWRQGYGNPGPEPVAGWLLGVGGVACAGLWLRKRGRAARRGGGWADAGAG